MNYAAYLRVYEPVMAFHEPERSRWAAYAESDARPRRRDALAAEHAEALRQLVVAPAAAAWAAPVPPPVVPAAESEHAYVRSVDGVWYVCPWQARLRALLATGRLPAASTDRPCIRESNWTVPLAWFVPFAGAERWIALGHGSRGQYGVDVRAPAQVARTLVYVTLMSRARRRVARGLAALRGLRQLAEASAPPDTSAPPEASASLEALASSDASAPSAPSAPWVPGASAELARVGRWLERFHPYSLVELDYGGLVHLFTDDALCGDESVAEIGAAIDGMSRGHCELALAMYGRAQERWRMFREFEQVN